MKDPIERDADEGDPYACLAMGYYYQTGKDYDQDDRLAVEWYERSASAGCRRAHWELARIYIEGVMVEQNVSHYLRHLVQSAEMGNADACMALAGEYLSGEYLDCNEEYAFRWFMHAAEAGVPKAKFMVGYCYARGIGVRKSEENAEKWYSSAVLLGDAELFMDIGMGFEFGIYALEMDDGQALAWYRHGMEKGHEKCLICYESLMAAQRGGERDTYESRMMKLANSVTEKEVTERNAALYLADEHFAHGLEERAFDDYTKAADLGSPYAMFSLAMFHHLGIGTRRNDALAMDLLNRAASAGSPDAQFYLGRMYDTGMLPKDESEIISNYAKASANGFLPALYYLHQYVEQPDVYIRANRRY